MGEVLLYLLLAGVGPSHVHTFQVIGFDITPNSGSSLRKVLRLNLSRFMDRLSAISVSATREHGLELTLRRMKEEWDSVNFTTSNVR